MTDQLADNMRHFMRQCEMLGQDPSGDRKVVSIDEDGRINIVLSGGDIQIGAVELKDHDSGVRADISVAGVAFGNALHVLTAEDVGGFARAPLVDPARRMTTSPIPGQQGIAADHGVSDALTPRVAANIIDDQNGVSADSGASDAGTQRVIPATDSPTYAQENDAAPAYTEQVGGKYEPVPDAQGDGDLAPFLINAYRRLINYADNLAIGATNVSEVAPALLEQTGGQTFRASAALAAAGAYDASPTEVPTGGKKYLTINPAYDEDAGAANGRLKYKVEGCVTTGGVDNWKPISAGEQQATVQGAATEVWLEPAEYEFDPLTAAEEGVSRVYDVRGFHKVRIPCCESGDVANPGVAEVEGTFAN